MLCVARDGYHANARPLPKILMIQLGDGYIEVGAKPVFQAAKHLPLVFQRLRVRDVDFQCEETDRHFRSSRASEGAQS
jgi:hypothetical protein